MILQAVYEMVSNPQVSGDDNRVAAAGRLAGQRVYIESRPQESDDVAIVLSLEGGEPQAKVNATPTCQQTGLSVEVWAKSRTNRQNVVKAGGLIDDLSTVLIQYTGEHAGIRIIDTFEAVAVQSRTEPPRDDSDDWHTVLSLGYLITHTVSRGSTIGEN